MIILVHIMPYLSREKNAYINKPDNDAVYFLCYDFLHRDNRWKIFETE